MKIKAEPLSDNEDKNEEELSNVRRSKRQRRVINWSVLKSFRKKRKKCDVDEDSIAAPCEVQSSSSETRIKSEKSLIEDLGSSTFNTLFNGYPGLESGSVSNDSPMVTSIPPSERDIEEAQEREQSPETTLTAESETESCNSPEKDDASFVVDHSYSAHPGEPLKKRIKQEKEILPEPEPEAPVFSSTVDIQTLAVYRALIDHTYSSITPSSLIDAVMLKHDYICRMSEMGQFTEYCDDSPHFLIASSSIKEEPAEKSGRTSKKAFKTKKEKKPNRTWKRRAKSPPAPVENNFVTNPKYLPKDKIMANCFECEFDLHGLPPKPDQYSQNELPKKKRKGLKVLKPQKPPPKMSEVEKKPDEITASPTPEDVKSRKRKRRWNQTGWPTKKQPKLYAAKEKTKCKVLLPEREISKVKGTSSKSSNSSENPKNRDRLAQTKKSDVEKTVPGLSLSIEEAVKRRRQSLCEARENKQAANSPTRERARRKVKSLYQRPIAEDSKEVESQIEKTAKGIGKGSKSESTSELQSPLSKPKKDSQSLDKEVGDSTDDNVEDEKTETAKGIGKGSKSESTSELQSPLSKPKKDSQSLDKEVGDSTDDNVEDEKTETAKGIGKGSKSESTSELQSPLSKPKKDSQSLDKEVGDSTDDNVEDEKTGISTRPKTAKGIGKGSKSESTSELQSPLSKPKKDSQSLDKEVGDSTDDNVEDEKTGISTRPKTAKGIRKGSKSESTSELQSPLSKPKKDSQCLDKEVGDSTDDKVEDEKTSISTRPTKGIRKGSKSESTSELQSPLSKPKKDKEVGDSTDDNVENEKTSTSTRPKRAKRRDYYKLQKMGRDSDSPSKDKSPEVSESKLEKDTGAGTSEAVADDNASEQSGDLPPKFEDEEPPSGCNTTLPGERSASSCSESNVDDTTELPKVMSKIDVNDPPVSDGEKKITSEANAASAATLPPSTSRNATDVSAGDEPKREDAKDKDDATSQSNSQLITDQTLNSGSMSREKQTFRDRLDFALRLLENGESVRKAAKASRVSRSCIQRHYLAKKRGEKIGTLGGQPKLSKDFEKALAERLMTLSEWGYTMDTFDLRKLAKMYADERGLKLWFKENLPGKKWVGNFLKRNSSVLSQRSAENIKRSRAEVDEDTVNDYFKQLDKKLEGVSPENIINYGVSYLQHHYEISSSIKASTPIMFACTAAGEMFPLYVVYKSKYLYDTWIKGGPSGTRYNRNESGKFDGTCFEDWMETVVIPKARLTRGRKVMIGDYLSSHISPKCMEFCRRYEIEFVFLPPNSTDLTQPLDTAVLRPIDTAWKRILLEWDKTKNKKYAAIPKDCFPRLLSGLMRVLKDNFKNDIQVGFKNCGIFPLDRASILQRLPQVSQSDRSGNNSLYSSCVGILKALRSPQGTYLRKKRKLRAKPGRSGPSKMESSEDSTEEESSLSALDSSEEEEVDEWDSDEGTNESDDGTANDHEETGQVGGSQEEDVHRGGVGPSGTECTEDLDSNMVENTHSKSAEQSPDTVEVPKLDSTEDSKNKGLPKQVPRVRQSIRQRVRHHLNKLFKMRCSKKQKCPTSPNIVKVQQQAVSQKIEEVATKGAKDPSKQHVVAPKHVPSASPKKRRRKKMFWRTSWKANFLSASKKKTNLGQRAASTIKPEENSETSPIKKDEPLEEVGPLGVVAAEVDAPRKQLDVDLSVVKDEPDEPERVGFSLSLADSLDCNEETTLMVSPSRQDVRGSESKDGNGLMSGNIQDCGGSKESLSNAERSPGERPQLSNTVNPNADSETDALTCNEVFSLEAEVVSPSIETLFQSGLNRNLEAVHNSDAFEPEYDSPFDLVHADSDEELRNSCYEGSDSGRPANFNSVEPQTQDLAPASPISIKSEEDDVFTSPDVTQDLEDEVASFGGELRNPWEKKKYSKYSFRTRRMLHSIGAISDEDDSILSDNSVFDDSEGFLSNNHSSEDNRFFKLPSIDVDDDRSRFIVNPRALVKLSGGIFRVWNSQNAQLPALKMREVSPMKTVPPILRKTGKITRSVSPPRIRFYNSIASTSSNDHLYCKQIGDRVIRPKPVDIIGEPVSLMGDWTKHPPKVIWREAPIDKTKVNLKIDKIPFNLSHSLQDGRQARFTNHSQTPPGSKCVRRAEAENGDPHELGDIVAIDKRSSPPRLRAYAPGMFEGPMDLKSKKRQPLDEAHFDEGSLVDEKSRTNPNRYTTYELTPEIERLDALVRERLGLPPMTTNYYYRKGGRPPFSYNTMAMMAIEKDRLKCARSKDVIEFVSNYFPFYRNLDSKWKQNLRLVLSSKKYFRNDKIGPQYFYSFSNQLRLPSDPAIYEMTEEACNNHDEKDLGSGDEVVETPDPLFPISSLQAHEEPPEEAEPDPFVPICSYSDEEPDDNGLPPPCDVMYGDDVREPLQAMGDTLADSLDTLKIKDEPEDQSGNDCGKTKESSTTKLGRKFTCPYCPASFGNLQDHMDHSITHPEVMKPCPLCDFSSPDSVQLLWHINSNHDS